MNIEWQRNELYAAAQALGKLAGWTPDQIAAVLPCSTFFAHEWTRTAKSCGTFSDLPHSMQPQQIPKALRRTIVCATKGKQAQSAHVMAKEITDAHVSESSVRCILHASGLVPHHLT